MLSFTTPSLTLMDSTARLGVVKRSSFGLPGQYGRRVTRANVLSLYDPEFCSRSLINYTGEFLYEAIESRRRTLLLLSSKLKIKNKKNLLLAL